MWQTWEIMISDRDRQKLRQLVSRKKTGNVPVNKNSEEEPTEENCAGKVGAY